MIVAEDVIQKACARNASVELSYIHLDGSVTTARARLIEMCDHEILADALMYADKGSREPR